MDTIEKKTNVIIYRAKLIEMCYESESYEEGCEKIYEYLVGVLKKQKIEDIWDVVIVDDRLVTPISYSMTKSNLLELANVLKLCKDREDNLEEKIVKALTDYITISASEVVGEDEAKVFIKLYETLVKEQ